MSSLRIALTFLTRIPLPARSESPESIARSLPWFPVVGAGIGLVTALTFATATRIWPLSIAATLAVAVASLLTGAFHEDGLADTADAFGGSFDRARALEIFKDPRLGTYGVLAVVLSVALRVGALAALGPTEALFVLPAAHALSRGLTLQMLLRLRPVAPGLGASFAGAATPALLVLTALSAVVLGSLCVGLLAGPLLLSGIPAVAVVAALARRRLDGVNGDVLGAGQQVGELSMLLAAVAAQAQGISGSWLV